MVKQIRMRIVAPHHIGHHGALSLTRRPRPKGDLHRTRTLQRIAQFGWLTSANKIDDSTLL
jgi:hypothetical protein